MSSFKRMPEAPKSLPRNAEFVLTLARFAEKSGKIPHLSKEGTDFRRVQRENQGWLPLFHALNHPCVVRWTLHDAVPSLKKAGNFRHSLQFLLRLTRKRTAGERHLIARGKAKRRPWSKVVNLVQALKGRHNNGLYRPFRACVSKIFLTQGDALGGSFAMVVRIKLQSSLRDFINRVAQFPAMNRGAIFVSSRTGAFDSSPPIHRWEERIRDSYSPVGTIEIK